LSSNVASIIQSIPQMFRWRMEREEISDNSYGATPVRLLDSTAARNPSGHHSIIPGRRPARSPLLRRPRPREQCTNGRKLYAAMQNRKVCCRLVGDAATAPFRHTLSRLQVERSQSILLQLQKLHTRIASLSAVRASDWSGNPFVAIVIGPFVTRPLPSTMDMPSCNGRLQPQHFNGAQAALCAERGSNHSRPFQHPTHNSGPISHR
ncbi:hypothetical protein CI238_06489, partial [Colletotrichum incanum]